MSYEVFNHAEKKYIPVKSLIFTIAFLVFYSFKPVSAQLWQWSNIVRNAKEGGGQSRAYLWIPENCSKSKGVVVAQNNMEELSILENVKFRKAMADVDFAEVWVAPSFDHLFNFKEGAGETFTGMMNDLADSSGYTELKNVPVIGIGHSAAASWPYYFGAWNPERTIACISVSGQWPYYRNAQFAPDIWSKEQNVDFIPCLETMGEYESAETWSVEGLKERKAHPQMPLSMLAAPGEGHFATSEEKCQFIAFYIKKAIQYRLPVQKSEGQPIVLTPIDPTKTGWLADKWRGNAPPTAPAAPVGLYKGNPDEAFWYFDEETAREVEKYEAKYRGLKPQLVGISVAGKMVPQRNTHLQINVPFQPEANGVAFHIKGAFYDSVPGGSPRPESWAGLPVGSSIGHAGNGVVFIEKISGPFHKQNDTTFILQLEKGLDSNAKTFVLTMAAKHPGDAQYRPAIQQAEIVIPSKQTEGAPQSIQFPQIVNQPRSKKQLILNAQSTAGLPVYYYVQEGPAVVEGNVLRFTKVPLRAAYPIKVTVVAWQYGRSAEPKVQSAMPVYRTFYISK